MHKAVRPQMFVFGCLALLICLSTTADLVIDLVFEEPEVAFKTDAAAEVPDNAAEHVLMPSERTTGSTEDTFTPPLQLDLDAFSVVVTVASLATPRAVPSLHHPPRNRPVAFSVPLRI